MDSLDLDQVMDEVIPRPHSKSQASTVAAFPSRQSSPARNDAAAALNLVSETAAAIRELEKQSAQAVARAHSVATAVKQNFERAEARADRAEAALRQAEAKVAELTAAITQTRKEIETLQSRLAAKEADLAASRQRADDADAAIQNIVEAIRTQLPVKPGIVAEKSGAAA